MANATQQKRVDHDNAQEHKMNTGADFFFDKAKRERCHNDQAKRQKKRQKLQCKRCTKWDQDLQRHTKNSVTKQTAKPKIWRPIRARNQGGSIQRRNYNGDRCKHRTARCTFVAVVQDKPQTPSCKCKREHPRPLTNDHHQCCRARSTRLTQPILHRRVSCRNPRRIIRRIAPDHRAQHNAQCNQCEPEQFLASFLNHCLRVAIQKRIALACLIRCHR